MDQFLSFDEAELSAVKAAKVCLFFSLKRRRAADSRFFFLQAVDERPALLQDGHGVISSGDQNARACDVGRGQGIEARLATC